MPCLNVETEFLWVGNKEVIRQDIFKYIGGNISGRQATAKMVICYKLQILYENILYIPKGFT